MLTTQVTLFVNDTTVSKSMVKYTSQITRESIVDVTGFVSKPDKTIASCSQTEVRHPTISTCLCTPPPDACALTSSRPMCRWRYSATAS